MDRLLEVCLIAAAWITSVPVVNAQVPSAPQNPAVAGPRARAVPKMQKGIHVELPVTHNAVPMPDADQEDSLIVSVRADGSLYFGVDPVTRADLAEKIKRRPGNKRLYIKVDARTAYANVVKVLVVLRAAGVAAPIFLTAQTDSSDFGALVPPKGLEVLTAPSGVESPVVEVLDSGPKSPALMVSGERVDSSALLNTLERRFQNQREKEVQLQADGVLTFGRVAQVIDVCRSAGAKVAILTPGMV